MANNGLQGFIAPGAAPRGATCTGDVSHKGLPEPSTAQNTPIVALFHTGKHCRRLN